MRRAPLVLTIAGLLLVRVSAHADDLFFTRFAEYLDSLRIQAGIPGLAAVIVGQHEILWERPFGRQDLERAVATQTDTPFHLDALTQVFTASLVLRCVEEGRFSLDDRIGRFKRDGPDADATIRQVLTHTSGGPENLVFSYRPERLDPLTIAVRTGGDSFRETLANLLERLVMWDSVPGPDVIRLVPPAEGIPSASAAERYTKALERLATPYTVDQAGRAARSQYAVTTLTPASGLVSSVRNLAEFDLALRNGWLLRAETLAAAWRAPVGRDGRPLPHGMGWFVQNYNGEKVVWQFGVSDSGSSALAITVPERGVTLILLANSTGLVKPFALAAGDVTTSPFARLFLGLFVR